MCAICVDVIKDRIKPKDIAKNYSEMYLDILHERHLAELNELLMQKGILDEVAKELYNLNKGK